MRPEVAGLNDLSMIFGDSLVGQEKFWCYYKNEFTFDGNDCVLKDLGFKLPVKEMELFHVPLRIYFAERKNYRIISVNGEVNIQIDGLEFTLPFPNGLFELLEIFRDKCYAGFNINDRVVVDVGAFIGDSALYFAKEGAKQVIAFEPIPELHALACKNVKKNNCTHRVEVRNCAVSDKYGTETLNVNPYWPGVSSQVQKNKLTYASSVKSEPLDAIIAELNDVALLKMDCEGMEYVLIPYAHKENALSHVKQICLEVHGPPQPIVDVLKQANFKVDYTRHEPNLLLRARKLGS